jgi:hypothetical protein
MPNHVVEELERQFLPTFEAMAEQLRSQFPNVQINACSHTVGAKTAHQGHYLWIDCCFRYAPPDIADNVALGIGVTHIDSDPHLCDLSVTWGADSTDECISTNLLESSIPWSPDAIHCIEDALPALFTTLAAALSNPPFPNEPPAESL